MLLRRVAPVLVLLLICAACAQPDSQVGAPAADGPAADDAGPDGTVRTMAMVLENAEHGPQLCHTVAESYPPQCGGPDILGWDWTGLTTESANGTTWGEFVVTGTWDGAALTLTEPPRVPTDDDRATPTAPDFTSPCPTPAGGWTAPDPSRAGEELIGRAAEIAVGVPGYGGLWIDTSPPVTVLNVTTAGDHAAMERAVREVWGGALCVSTAPNDEATLLAAQRQIASRVDVLTSAPEVLTGRLLVQVYVADPQLQAELDDEFGPGVVVLEGVLVPVD